MRICETCEYGPGSSTCEICTETIKRKPENPKSYMVTRYEEGKVPEWVWFSKTEEGAEKYIEEHPEDLLDIEYTTGYFILRIMEEEGWK